MTAGPFLLLVAGIAAVIAVLVISHRLEEKRREKLALFALSKGWEFSPIDSFGLADRWQHAPFGTGHSRRAWNVFSGTVNGWSMVAFDYRYQVTTSNGKTTSTDTYDFGVCAIRLPAYLPPLQVTPESLLSRFGNALGLDDVELESEDFNRAFRVHGERKFAHDVLSPRAMELLLRGGCRSLRVDGVDLIGWDTGRTDVGELVAMVETLTRWAALVPSFVWKDHGYDPGQASPTTAPGTGGM